MASPFNRPNQGPFQGQPPPSFKTNVNRNKTKKWLEAKGYSYDGDDWGEYDETDEYGVEHDHPEPVPQLPHAPMLQQQQQRVTGFRQAGQSAGGPSGGGRNFTDPHDAPAQAIQRQQSFDVGDERRAFSTGLNRQPQPGQLQDIHQGTPLHVNTEVPSATIHRADTSSSHYPSSGGLASSAENTPYSANPTHRQDFLPGAMPQPLQSMGGIGHSQGAVDASSTSAARPPRKSSLGQITLPVAAEAQAPVEEETPRQRAPSNPTKPLPFIRPADIYKRMEEERARERASSQDSSRPSMDSLLRPNEDSRGTPSKKSSSESLPSAHEERTGTPASQKKPALPTVAEGQPAFASDSSAARGGGRDFLPPSETSPSFSDEFQQFSRPQEQAPLPGSEAGLQHQPSSGFRSVVEQAFDQTGGAKSETSGTSEGGLRSASQSDVSRSNTDSTAGISPIMSRVPSVGTAAARAQHPSYDSFDHNATPTIAEEPAGSSRPTSLEGLPVPSTPRQQLPSHSREVSAESAFMPGYRRQDTPPSRGSPARTPALEQGRETPEPQVAHVAASTPTAGPLYREADMAQAVNSRPSTAGKPQPETATAEPKEPFRSASPAKSRSQSPSKSRVQQLAGGFDELAEANSRRNSSHSVASRQSWEVDSRKSWAEGPEQIQVEPKPPLQTESSFRPKLPGQWESFATNRPDSEPAVPESSSGGLPADRAAETELDPTTAKNTLRSDNVQDETPSITQNPIAALTAAGAAIGQSLRSSVGRGNDASKEGERDGPDDSERTGDETDRLAVGDIVSRPGALRVQSAASYSSTVPPTPPPKDDNTLQPFGGNGGAKPPVPLKHDVAQVDTGAPSDDEDENDRLSREIVRSLSPEKDSVNHLRPASDHPQGNRESNILPSEYGDYWEGATPEGTRFSRAPGDVSVGPRGVELTKPENIPEEKSTADKELPSRPGFLDNRFSWEKSRDSIGFSQFANLGSTSDNSAPVTGDATPGHRHQLSDGSNAPEVVEPSPQPVAEPSATVDDLPRLSSERSASPAPAGLHIVNVRGAEEAVDLPPRLKTPEPPSEPRSSHEEVSGGAEISPLPDTSSANDARNSVDERDFAAPSDGDAALALVPSLAPAVEVDSRAIDVSKARIPPFRELAAIPSPKDRIKAYDSTREQFASTDTGLQGWLTQTIAANPEHSHLLKGGPIFPINTQTAGAGSRPGHRSSPSMTKFANMMSPNSPQQTHLDAPRPGQGSSPLASQGSGGGSLGAQKGKELLQNAGVLSGKVGQGAKGLFAKGKNKLRAASGSDKVSTPVVATAASNATPSPTPSQTLSRASTQPLEASRSIEQPTPTRPRFSPFRRFSSRPSSTVVSEADTIPEAESEALPSSSRHSTPDNRSTGSGISISKRRMSPFRRRSSRPSSAVTVDSMAAVPEIPKEPLPTHQRSATFGGTLVGTTSKDEEDKGKLKGLRRLSAFRRGSRPESLVAFNKTSQEAHFPGGFPKGLTYTGDRRASYAFGSTVPMPHATVAEQRRASLAVGAARAALPPAPDIFGGPEDKPQSAQDKRPPSQLGILPSPTKDSFGVSSSEPPSPTTQDDSTPRATQFNPDQVALQDHLDQFVSSPTAAGDFESQPPQRHDTSKSAASEENNVRHSRLIESIVRHASPPLKDIESRRQSRVGLESETGHLPLPNMGSVSGAPTPSAEISDPLSSKTPPPATRILPPVLPTIKTPKSSSVKEGKRPTREEIIPSPEPPLPPAGGGVIPTSPVDRGKEAQQLPSVDRTLSAASKSSPAVSALEPSPELDAKEGQAGVESTLVSREISSASSRPDLGDRALSNEGMTVSREISQVSKSSRPDVSPISDDEGEVRAKLGPVQAVTYGERKADWLDSDEDEAATPMEQPRPRVTSTVPVPYGQMDKEITIEPISRASTDDEWDKVSRGDTARGDGTETREGWHTPVEEFEQDDEDVEINEAGTASSGHVRQISDIAKLNRESLRIKAEVVAAAARASAMEEPLPVDAARSQHFADEEPQANVPTAPPHEHDAVPEVNIPTFHQTAAGAEQEDLPPPVPPKSPGPAVPARQSPFNERAAVPTPPQESQARGLLQRPSFGQERPLSFQMLPRPASGSVPQEQINVASAQAVPPGQPSLPASPPRIRPPIPEQRDYSQTQETAQAQNSPEDDSPRAGGLRRISGPVQPPPPSQRVRQKSIDRLSQSMQLPGTDPQINPPRSFMGYGQGIDARHKAIDPQPWESRTPPVGVLRGMSQQPSPRPYEQQPQQSMTTPQTVPQRGPLMSPQQPPDPAMDSPEERRVKKGFFSGLRPPSSGADTVLTMDSTRAQPSVSPTKIHYLSEIERQKEQGAASGKLSKVDKRIERAQSSGEPTGGKKKRFSSLTGLFGRSGTTGHAPPSRATGSARKLQKITEQKTPSPAQGQIGAPPPLPQSYPPQQRPQDFPSQPHQAPGRGWARPAPAYQEQTGVPADEEIVNIPAGGFYAPENNGFATGQSSKGYSAISQQADSSYSYGQGRPTLPNVQESRMTTYINGGQHSPPPHRWRPADESPFGVAAAPSPVPVRHMSAGAYGQSLPQSGTSVNSPSAYEPTPPPVRHVSAPGYSHGYDRLRPQHAPRMPSVGEDGRHQERPWAIQLPQGPPDPENDAHRRDSIQYAMMVRQQMAQQQTTLQQRSPQAAYQGQQYQYTPPPQSQTFHSHGQPPYDMPTYPAPGGQHPQGRYSEIRDSRGPVLTLDPAAIARIQLEAQERARQRDVEEQQILQQQQQEEERLLRQRPYTAPDDENSLYAPPTRPQTAHPTHHSPTPPLPAQYAYSGSGHDTQNPNQRVYQPVPHATEPHHYPLPTSPIDTIASPINPIAGQMAPPPLPSMPQPPQFQPQNDPDSKAVGFGAHHHYPSASSIAAPPPPYQRSARASADERMDVPSETLMQTERRTEQLRSQIDARRQQGGEQSPIEQSRQQQEQWRQQQQQQQQQRRRQDDDEPVVMHAASYPGMEWEPRWED